jgi:PKD repeat protein
MTHTIVFTQERLTIPGGRQPVQSCAGQSRRQGRRTGTTLLALCIVLLALTVIPGPVAATTDLQVTFAQANYGGATAGSVFTFSTNPVRVQVKNNGTETSPVAVLLLTSSGGFSGTATIPAITSGGSKGITINDTTILQTAGSTVTYTATADPDNLIAESVETNNVYTTAVLPVMFNGYKGKALYGGVGGNVTTKKTYDLHGGIVHSFGNSFYRSGSFSDGWTDYDVTWKYNAANASAPAGFELVVPANATVREVRLYLPYTWDLGGNGTYTYDIPNNVTVTFNGNTINYDSWSYDRGNFGEWGLYTYGLLTYDVTSLYHKNATNSLHFTRPGMNDKLSLYGMTLAVVYDNPAESRKQIFLNEEFDLLGADYANYKTTPAEATAYVPFSGMSIDTAAARTAILSTFVPSGDSNEGNLYVNGNLVAANVWNYGAAGQPVGENGYPQVAVDVRDIKSDLAATGNVIAIQSTAWNTSPCMAAAQQMLVVDYYNAPVADFAADTVSGSAPLNVTFIDRSTNSPTSWAWDFNNDSTIDSTIQNPAYSYTAAGTYTVNLTATNLGGSGVKQMVNYITVSAAASPVALPGYTNLPTDPDSDGLYEDLNANGAIDFDDVIVFFNHMAWMQGNEPAALFDFNKNSEIDFDDIIRLFLKM